MTSDAPSVSATTPDATAARVPTGPVAGFVPALEGMRGLAAVGVLLTHVAFQTGTFSVPVVGPLLGRLDLAVAVFFALSGFLLWRPHAAAARGLGPEPSARRYLMHRAARILPVYWVVVILVLALLPGAGGGLGLWLANLTLVQVFVPLSLTQGLTQMWSLSVEVAFYLLLPLFGWLLVRLSGPRARWRVPVLLGVAAASTAWTFLPIATVDGVNIENWLPGYLSWFAAGMVVAETAAEVAARPVGSVRPRLARIADRRWTLLAVAAVAFAVAATPVAGEQDLTTPAAWQFAVKVSLGALVSFCLLAPLVLGTSVRTRWLGGEFAVTIGRWSYGIFVWHLAVLAVVFPVLGISPFAGQFPLVAAATLVLTVPVAAAGYALIEEPVRVFVRDRERRRRAVRPASEDDSAAVASNTETAGAATASTAAP